MLLFTRAASNGEGPGIMDRKWLKINIPLKISYVNLKNQKLQGPND